MMSIIQYRLICQIKSINMKSNLLELLASKTAQPVEILSSVVEKYPFSIPSFIVDRVNAGTYSMQALKQYIPDIRELDTTDGYLPDPYCEKDALAESNVIQKYGNRAAIILTQNCLVFCRFCFRKQFVGFPQNKIDDSQLKNAVDILKNNIQIEDVLLSGGDPLSIPDSKLIPFLIEIGNIPHIKVIRLHSRAVSVMPSRITSQLIDVFKSIPKFWYYAHINHPDDINHPEIIDSIRKIQNSGVNVLNQCVLLKGVNDNVYILKQMLKSCYYQKVIPYNLYLTDKVKGTSHFEVSKEQIIDLYDSLSELPGPAIPSLVFFDANGVKHRYQATPNSNIKTFLEWIK